MNRLDKIYKSLPIVFQNILVTCYGLKIYHERYRYRYRKLKRETDWLGNSSRKEIEKYQILRLRAILKHASLYVPFYKEFMKSNGIDPNQIRQLNDLQQFPVVNKKQIRENPSLFISKKNQPIIHGHTSGTTGTPLNIIYSSNVGIAMAVCDWRHMIACGRMRKDKIGIFLGRTIVPISQKKPPFWRYNFVHNEIWFSSFHLKEENLMCYVNKIKKSRIYYLKAYPSTAYILAKFCYDNKIKLKLKAVFTSSETLFQHQRNLIEQTFRCRIYDYYGHAERAIFANECYQHNGLHVNEDFGIVECLDKNGNPVPEGQSGMLVVTSLHNFAMPFIRYETGDVSSILPERCACGKNYKRICAVTTKAEDIIVTPEGKKISSSILTHPFKPINGIIKSQIIQDKADSVTIKLIVDNKFDHLQKKLLYSALKERLGETMNLSFVFVDDIPSNRNGKYRWVISKYGISPYSINKTT